MNEKRILDESGPVRKLNEGMATKSPLSDRITQMYDGRPIVTYDLFSRPGVQKLLRSGYHIDPETGKITTILRSKAHDVPWVYTRSDPRLNCTLWTEVHFKALDIFPEPCLNCWKVVVRPRTFKELIMLLEIQKEHTTRFCKCGIELRDYVHGNYGGYFYNHGMTEGLDCLDDVRGLVAEHISPDVPVVLKRYCTEFELKFGPSNEVEQTLERGYFIHPEQGKVAVMSQGDMSMWRQIASQAFDVDPGKVICGCWNPKLPESEHVKKNPWPGGGCDDCNGLGWHAIPQPDMVQQHVVRTWIDYAYAHGDKTVLEFFGGEPLYTPSVTYEREASERQG
jgi:hypothetical protein